MVLHRQILFSLAIADFAEAILMRTSAEQVPSLHRVAPRYLKLAEILAVKANICTDVIRSVGHDLTLFSADFHSVCRCSVSSLLVRSWSSPLQPPIRSTSSANHRLHMSLAPKEMDVWWSWSVSCKIFSGNKLNRMGESKHSCRAATVVSKNSPS